MAKRENSADYRQLFLNDTPFMDVRAPIEFEKGAFPTSRNLPLMDDKQRELVGTRYKEQGQDQAIVLGNELASPEIRQMRVAAWKAFIAEHPEGYLYCFRGGLRSKTTQHWLAEQGIDYPFIEGGYKALRRFLIDEMDEAALQTRQFVVGGFTGTGKTIMINQVDNGVDLEGIANHKGSSFGKQIGGQPTQINFENQLALRILKLREQGINTLVFEDEGRAVGRCSVPIPLRDACDKAPVVVIEEPMDVRIDRLQLEYVTEMHAKYLAAYPADEGYQLFSEYILTAIDGIRKRFGGERHKQVRSVLENALNSGCVAKVGEVYRETIGQLLVEYYDPMYEYQLGQKQDRIVYRGNYQAVFEYLQRDECR